MITEYWIDHVAIRVFNNNKLIFPIRIFHKGVPGFATDCPWGVLCRGLTTCLLYVGPLFDISKQQFLCNYGITENTVFIVSDYIHAHVFAYILISRNIILCFCSYLFCFSFTSKILIHYCQVPLSPSIDVDVALSIVIDITVIWKMTSLSSVSKYHMRKSNLSNLLFSTLTYRGRDKLTAIFQTTFSNGFPEWK